jgi:hypothetical protein
VLTTNFVKAELAVDEEPMRFTLDQWKEFTYAVVAFAAPQQGPGAGKSFVELPAL